MTASETAARKKELTENFTLEELVDLYLSSEWKCKDYEAKNRAQEARIGELKVEIQRLEAISQRREIEDLTQNECFNAAMRRINQLDAAIDVLLAKYVQKVVTANED